MRAGLPHREAWTRFDEMERWGFPVTRRGDGLFDIANLGRGVTAGQVMDSWLTMRAWPRLVGRQSPPIEQPGEGHCGRW